MKLNREFSELKIWCSKRIFLKLKPVSRRRSHSAPLRSAQGGGAWLEKR
ncbi:MAG: hypothetical protein ACI9YL_002072, partial [Luteibaculaceae bacterium]